MPVPQRMPLSAGITKLAEAPAPAAPGNSVSWG